MISVFTSLWIYGVAIDSSWSYINAFANCFSVQNREVISLESWCGIKNISEQGKLNHKRKSSKEEETSLDNLHYGIYHWTNEHWLSNNTKSTMVYHILCICVSVYIASYQQSILRYSAEDSKLTTSVINMER